ncbi:type II toxin-antitoxin system HicA family toxin [Spirochaetota bacterium]
MPKVPVVSGLEIIKAFEKMGFSVVRQKGSHVILRKETSACVVPKHREIKKGTLLGILKQANISLEDFLLQLHNS